MARTLLAFLVFNLAACQLPPYGDRPANKDSVLKRYLALIDSLDYYDTTDRDYQTLRAYAKNDTHFFKYMIYEMDVAEKCSHFGSLESFVRSKKISDLDVDESYRFIHTQSFCPAGQVITISRAKDSVHLHYAEYLLPDLDGNFKEFISKDGKRYLVTTDPVLIKEINRSLKITDWEKLEQSIRYADYWGLKMIEPDGCVDGSHWSIDAYVRAGRYPDNQKVHFVSRHCYRSRDFNELGRVFLKLSGEKTMCSEFF